MCVFCVFVSLVFDLFISLYSQKKTKKKKTYEKFYPLRFWAYSVITSPFALWLCNLCNKTMKHPKNITKLTHWNTNTIVFTKHVHDHDLCTPITITMSTAKRFLGSLLKISLLEPFKATWTKYYCTFKKQKREFTMLQFNQMNHSFTRPEAREDEKLTLFSCQRRASEFEKRFCFDLTFKEKPGIVYTFQALSEKDHRSWLSAMDGTEPVSQKNLLSPSFTFSISNLLCFPL